MSILLIVVFVSSTIFAQSDWERWSAEEVSYELENLEYRDYSLDNESLGSTLLTGFRNIYWFFISDVDGDNCPFSPSCSSFLVESAKSTNFFQGMLMFADRFTRDSNFYKKPAQYTLRHKGKFYDPAYKHTLNKDEIKNYFLKATNHK